MGVPLLEPLDNSLEETWWKAFEPGDPPAEELGENLWIELTTRVINSDWAAAQRLCRSFFGHARTNERAMYCLYHMMACVLRDGVPGFDRSDAEDALEERCYLKHTLFCLMASCNEAYRLALQGRIRMPGTFSVMVGTVNEECRLRAGESRATWATGTLVYYDRLAATRDGTAVRGCVDLALARHGLLLPLLTTPTEDLLSALLATHQNASLQPDERAQ